jgi:hypothetical protein
MLVEKWTKDDKVFEIHTDDDPLNPRKEFDQLGVMYCWHGRHIFGDVQPQESPAVVLETIKKDGGPYLELGLTDHSGLGIHVMVSGMPWHAYRAGYIHMPKEVMEREGLTEEQALEGLKAEVEAYDQYLRGEIYGFNFNKLETCPTCGHQEEADSDSCWGFYGSDHGASGLYDHAGVKPSEEEGWTRADI